MIDDAVNQLRRLDEELETLLTSFDTSYAWNYGSVKEGLRDLYEKSKREQWNGTTQLAWDTDVDPESEIVPSVINPLRDYPPFQKLTGKDLVRARHGQLALQLSQFLHGEQGAMIVASQLVGGVPWLEAKYYASSQTMDEARHVEVFSRYVREELMRDRLIGSEFARAMSWNVQEVQKAVLESEVGRMFRSMLFQRIVPNLKKLGLLTPKVRAAYTRLDLIRFEDFDSEAADRQLGFL